MTSVYLITHCSGPLAHLPSAPVLVTTRSLRSGPLESRPADSLQRITRQTLECRG